MKIISNLLKPFGIVVASCMLVLSLSTTALAAPTTTTVGVDPCENVQTQFGCNGIFKEIKKTFTNSKGIATIQSVIGGVAVSATVVIAAIAVLFVLWGAWKYMSGDAKGGAAIVKNAVIGLIISLLAFGVVSLIVGVLQNLSTTSA
jgi:hypothetical protein